MQKIQTADYDKLKAQSVQTLQDVIKQTEVKIVELEESLALIENRMQPTMGYNSREATRNGLLSFWGKREGAQKQLDDLSASVDKLSLSINIPSIPKEANSEGNSVMNMFFKVGENYSQLSGQLDALRRIVVVMKGIIAEKELNLNLNSKEALQDVYRIMEKMSKSAQGNNGQSEPAKSSDFGSSFKKGFMSPSP